MTIRLVCCDIGGTHARFALAQVGHGGSIALGEPITFETRDYPSFTLALQAFAHLQGTHLPQALAIAIAGPVDANADKGSVIRFTNNPWLIQPGQIAAELALDQITLVNDFAAVGHAVARAGAADFLPLTGQRTMLPATGMVSIVGPRRSAMARRQRQLPCSSDRRRAHRPRPGRSRRRRNPCAIEGASRSGFCRTHGFRSCNHRHISDACGHGRQALSAAG